MKSEFIDFIKYSLEESLQVPKSFERIDWSEFFVFCCRHSIAGIALNGLERANRKIPQQVLFEWIGVVEGIKQHNTTVNKRVAQISQWFNDKGHRSVILKGQANGLMYPIPELRSPGDIDIWVEGNQEEIIKLVLKEFPDAHYSLHHVVMPIFNDVSVEVHYRPIYLINWFADKKLQKYVNEIQDAQFANRHVLNAYEIGSLTDDFNIVYQLLHMYAHLFSTRNNFKQMIDYYYLLKKANGSFDKAVLRELLQRFDVLKYAKGIMWIMHHVLGLKKDILVVEPDERIGKLLLGETLKYGMYQNRTAKDLIKQSVGNLKLASVFPKNVLISPLFLIWHQWWRVKMKLSL